MIDRLIRIIKSCFALPKWVFIWVFFILVPANFSGIFFLQYETAFWVMVLGMGGILPNIVLLFLNGGMSKVLAIPHLIFWIPLHFILINLWFNRPDMSEFEQNYLLIILAINTISLAFDFYDANEWRKGKRDVVGFEGEPVWI